VKFTLEIKLGNDAMDMQDDLADALRAIATRVENEPTPLQPTGCVIRDINGNTVGRWEIKS
jgi:hypothetical protein